MEPFAALDASAASTRHVVAQIRTDQWTLPTPCSEWDVRALVEHLITWMNVYADLLRGAAVDEVQPLLAPLDELPESDVLLAYDAAAARATAAFREDGALDRVVHHPLRDMPGSYLLGMRITDNVLHGWDLSVALSRSAVIEPEFAQMVHDFLAPHGPGLAASGYFAVPLREISEDVDVQQRLLTLTGR
ncbi:MAG: TIGR03086 family metal-binding protein [Mycobacteriales bacterium]